MSREPFTLEWWTDQLIKCVSVYEWYSNSGFQPDYKQFIRYLQLAWYIQKRIINKYGETRMSNVREDNA